MGEGALVATRSFGCMRRFQLPAPVPPPLSCAPPSTHAETCSLFSCSSPCATLTPPLPAASPVHFRLHLLEAHCAVWPHTIVAAVYAPVSATRRLVCLSEGNGGGELARRRGSFLSWLGLGGSCTYSGWSVDRLKRLVRSTHRRAQKTGGWRCWFCTCWPASEVLLSAQAWAALQPHASLSVQLFGAAGVQVQPVVCHSLLPATHRPLCALHSRRSMQVSAILRCLSGQSASVRSSARRRGCCLRRRCRTGRCWRSAQR